MTLARCAHAIAWCALVPILVGCGAVLGIEEWDVEPGAGGGAGTSTSTTSVGEGPGSTGGAGGAGDGGAGTGGGGDGGAGGGGSTVTTTGAGGEGGCGVPDTSEHCGACGRSCWGGECMGGATCGPTLLHPNPARVDLLAVSGDHVVFVDGTGELRRVRKSRPNPSPDDSSLGGIPGTVSSVAVGSFDAEYAAVYAREGRITRRLLDQPDPSPLVLFDDPAYAPLGLVPSGGYVYWFDYTSISDKGVHRSGWTEAGSSQRHCIGNLVRDLAMIGATAYYVDSYSTSPSRRLYFCTGGGAGPSDFLTNAPGHLPLEVEADASTGLVYYTTIPNPDAGVESALWRKASAAAPPERVVAPAGFSLQRFTHGGPYLYGRTSTGELVATSKEPDQPIDVLASDQIQAIAADDEGVYWSGASGIWALRRDAAP